MPKAIAKWTQTITYETDGTPEKIAKQLEMDRKRFAQYTRIMFDKTNGDPGDIRTETVTVELVPEGGDSDERRTL